MKTNFWDIEAWEANPNLYMDLDHLKKIIKEGLTTCEGYCDSREIWGESRCDCVREAFPNPLYYQIYKGMREIYVLHEVEQAIRKESNESRRTIEESVQI